MYNLKKRFIFLGEKFEKKKLGLPRLLYLDYDYFRSLKCRLRLLLKSDFAHFLDYDYFRKPRCTRLLDYDYFLQKTTLYSITRLRLLQKTTLRSITRLRLLLKKAANLFGHHWPQRQP